MEASKNAHGVKMWENYKKSKPLPVQGGIKLSARKKNLIESWWGNRWIETIESFEDAARLSRGRSYAKKGQVLDIKILRGKISAKVQGSRLKPYQVAIELESLSPHAWNLVIEALAQKALYSARLFAGELPKEIEAIFDEIKIPLLPSHYEDLSTDCTCPDWSNPCKHIAAVLYLLGEEFGRDPFLIFKARGMDRETFLKKLEEHSLSANVSPSEDPSGEHLPLSDSPEFWHGKEIPSDYLAGAFEIGSQNGTILKSLGKFPFWRGEKDLPSFLEPVYKRASQDAFDSYTEKE